jgi:peptidylprolyl isomerase
MQAIRLGLLVFPALLMSAGASAAGRTMADVLADSKPEDWREPAPENTLYLELSSGRVVIELAPEFAPRHVANIKTLVRAGYFDGLTIYRVQDNFVAQWGDPDGKKPLGAAAKSLAPEFERSAAGLKFVALPDPDTYAPQTGFVNGFPAARDKPDGTVWLAHCYGTVGVGRDVAADSGNGSELYAVIGHAPRQLEHNITTVGRVLKGMELLSALPRGTEAMGYYEKPEQRVPIRQIRVAADLPQSQRSHIEVLRTDTQTFTDLIESRRNRRDEWYKVPAGRIDVCNVPLPVREKMPAD